MVRACSEVGQDAALGQAHGVQGRSRLCEGAATEESSVSDDRLVVGYGEFVKAVAAGLEATDQHSCQEQDGVDYKAMAQTLWASGYRFDATARVQWLVVEMRSKMDAAHVALLNEMLTLLGHDV